MGDVGDYWRDHKEYKRQQKKDWVASAERVFSRLKLNYSRLTGDHWRIYHEGKEVDFWPTTGAWRTDDMPKARHGLKHLLNFLGFEDERSKHDNLQKSRTARTGGDNQDGGTGSQRRPHTFTR